MNNELIQRAVAAFIQVIGPNRSSLTDEEIDLYIDNILPLFQAQWKACIRAHRLQTPLAAARLQFPQ